MAEQGILSAVVAEVQTDSTVKIPTIPEVFYGKTVLITGATGFVGKVLLEKLLRSCPGISEIIVIIRANSREEFKGKCNKLMNHGVFDRLKEECPGALNKVRAIEGHVSFIDFGVLPSDKEKLCDEVSFVFHCAANVRFDCKPDLTLKDNLKGVDQLLKLCKQMNKLEAVVHVSTAFSFCNQPIIGEAIYAERIGPAPILDALEWMNETQLKHFSEYLTEGRPSLYHASKAMAEILISEKRDNLPIIIVRPSIVTASVKEPFPGWVDNYNGPSGFIALSSKGILKTLLVNKKVNADWVPVDVVANTLIAAAHFMVLQKWNSGNSSQIDISKVSIINCVVPEENLIKWSKIVDICLPILFKYPSATIFSMPGGVVTSSRTVNTLCKYLLHYLPAYILDLIFLLVWQDLKLVNTYFRIHGVLKHLQLYTMQQFLFTSKNMQRLHTEMSPADRSIFPVDLKSLDWPSYMQDYVLGVRRYFLKEKDETLPAARRRVKVLTAFHNVSIFTLTGSLLYLLATRFPTKQSSSQMKHATVEMFKSCWKLMPNIPNRHVLKL